MQDIAQAEQHTIEKLGISVQTLMETAGQRAFSLFEQKGAMGNMLIMAGPGNNGGDALVFARYASLANLNPTIILLAPNKRNEAHAHQVSVLERMGVSMMEIATQDQWTEYWRNHHTQWDWIIDGIFGVGLDRPLEGMFKQVVDDLSTMAEDTHCKVLGLDVPTGLHAQTGKKMGALLPSDLLASFGFLKPGFFLQQGPKHCGAIEWLPVSIVPPALPKHPMHLLHDVSLQTPTEVDHKGDRGHALVIAGSKAFSGAAILSSLACQKSGAGLTTLATTEDAHDPIKSQLIDVMSAPLSNQAASMAEQIPKLIDDKSAILVGPGLPENAWTEQCVAQVLQHACAPVVVDAGGLVYASKWLEQHPTHQKTIIVTPHPGELAKMTEKSIQEIQENRMEVARTFAQNHNVWTVLKGAYTVIASPEGESWVNPTGDRTLSVGGAGDVLAGMMVSFLAQGVALEQALCQAVFHHGLLGQKRGAATNGRAILASELLPMVETLFQVHP